MLELDGDAKVFERGLKLACAHKPFLINGYAVYKVFLIFFDLQQMRTQQRRVHQEPGLDATSKNQVHDPPLARWEIGG